MSVYKITLGTPEQLVPTAFSPESKTKIIPLPSENARDLHYRQTSRGLLIEFPLNPENEVYGFGLQLKGFRQTNRKKTIRPNADPISNTGDSHAPVPFFVTTEGWGIFVDTARYVEFNCGYTKVSTAQTAAHSRLKSAFADIYAHREVSYPTVFTIDIPHVKGVDLYIFKGKDMLDCICQYNLFAGGGCDVSLWGLGNLYRCHLEFNENQVLSMAEKFRKMEIPCDILGLEPGWQSCSYSSSFVWDSERFPHYKEMLTKLSEMGFKVNLWEQGFVHPDSPLYERLLPYSGDYKVWDGLVPDFSTDGAKEIFVNHHRELQALGVKGYKLDECDGSDYTGHWTFPLCSEFPSGMDGEQYHSLFGTLFLQTMMKVHGSEKTFAEIRNLGALASSYPFVLYSDLYNHKDFIRGVANAGFSGLLWSPEVRHAESKEDLIRRVQTVVFSVQSLINAFYLDDMPWIDKECTEEIKALLELRMALIPYLYAAFYDYKTTGKPPVRALVCEHPEDQNTHELWDEYYFGDSMIVAPMTAGETSRKIYLPNGEWYGFFDGKKYEGGKTFELESAEIPVFVKSGTVLPLAKPVQYIERDTQFEITLYCYGNTEGVRAKLVEDNGFEYADDTRVLRVSEDTASVSSYRYSIKEIKKIL